MLTFDCTLGAIPVRLVDCAAEPITAAHLHRRDCASIALTPVQDPDHADRVLLQVPTDAPLSRGVWRLALETTCACFDAPVFVDICRPPAFPGTHYPTAGTEPVTVCCAPELQPDWATPPVVLGFIAGGSNGLVGYDSDLGMGTLLLPAPVTTDFKLVTTAEPPTFAGTLAPVQAGYTRWTLIDSSGVTRMTGTIAGTALHTDDIVPLSCHATYYVRIEP